MKYIFGPVPSRRLGLSLGVDLVPPKTCSMDCIYCESGRTTCLTLRRREYVKTADVIEELDQFLIHSPALDYITFSGAGEPTLHSGIGIVMRHLKENYPKYKICLLTNGTLLGNDELLNELLPLDLIIPSLDAAIESIFQKVSRPISGISVSELIDSFVKFRKSSKALFWLEIFVLPGVNDSAVSIKALAEAVRRIKPDKIQLNTLDRPGAETWVRKANEDELKPFIRVFEMFVPVEVIGRYTIGNVENDFLMKNGSVGRIIELIRRRPCTLEDITKALYLSRDEALSLLKPLVEDGRVKTEQLERGCFYKI